jgi:hypothetical protein
MLYSALGICPIGSDSSNLVPCGSAGAIPAPHPKRTAFGQIPAKTAAARVNWFFAGSNPAVPVQTGIEKCCLVSPQKPGIPSGFCNNERAVYTADSASRKRRVQLPKRTADTKNDRNGTYSNPNITF